MPNQPEPQFTVDSEGWLHESSATDALDGLLQAVPQADRTALEAEFMLLRAARQIISLRDAHWAKYGLNYSRVLLLRLLFTSPKSGLSMGELASRMNLGSNSVTQLVDSLTQRDLVERASGANDKRVVFVSLTDAGRELSEALLPENVERIADTWSPLTKKERQAMAHFLAKVRLHLLANDTARIEDVLIPDSSM